MNSIEMYKVLPALRMTMMDKRGCGVLIRDDSTSAEAVVSEDSLELARGLDAVKLEGAGTYKFVSAPSGKRLDHKIAIVTGGAQGFGRGLVEGMLAHGAFVAIADINAELAKSVSDELNCIYGNGRTCAIAVDVGNDASVKEMVAQVVSNFGGLDIFVSNAGILKAGGLEEMDAETFERVTKINYTAYFLCAKYASEIMKIQNKVNPGYWMDIIQINSKSGLTGSARNFAYAGGKFGGIGLTQSFALELAGNNIKVNSICPGNFYDGPLWSDPERGLFVQYLNAGKVPGAKTVEDVREFYLSKTPIRRGCTADDVLKGLLYLVDQEYETGQALPITGGQTMLS